MHGSTPTTTDGMPGAAVHLHLAHRALGRWRRRPRTAPFDILDPVLLNAVRVGAMGPDAGYVPGGFRPLSDLAHTLRSGTLTRALLDAAREPLERASRGAGSPTSWPIPGSTPWWGVRWASCSRDPRDTFVDGDRDPLSHVRLETGLDARSADRQHDASFRPVFDPRTIGFIRGAYRRTYGVAPDRRRLLTFHCRLPRRMAQGLVLMRLSGRILPSDPGPEEDPGPLRCLRAGVGRTSASTAFLLPAPPRPWLPEAVREVEDGFEDDVAAVQASGGACLPDVNLDTGGPDLLEAEYAGLRRACAYIRGQGGIPPRLREPVPGAA